MSVWNVNQIYVLKLPTISWQKTMLNFCSTWIGIRFELRLVVGRGRDSLNIDLVIYCSSIGSSMSLSSLAAAASEVDDGSSALPHSRCWTHVNPANVGQNGKNWLHVCRRTSDMKSGRSYVENLLLLAFTDRLLPRAIIPSSAPVMFSSVTSTAEPLGLIPRSASLPTHQSLTAVSHSSFTAYA